jgi:RNA recognition motif-containing protein
MEKNKIFVGNLHPSVSEGDLLKYFQKYGKMQRIDYKWHMTGPKRGLPRGFAFIVYENENDAISACSRADKVIFKGNPLLVKLSEPMTQDAVSSSNNRSNSYSSSTKVITTSQEYRIGAARTNLKRSREPNSSATSDKAITSSSIDYKIRRLQESLRKLDK